MNRCLDYAKASRGLRLVQRYEPFSLREALELPLQCVRNLQSRIRVCMDWESLPSTVCGCIFTDKQWLQENLLCLLSNAVKYSAEGQVDVSVCLEEVCVNNNNNNNESIDCGKGREITQFLRFEVQDTGIGMSEEEMLSLFNPFKQTQRLAGGTGLGLYSLAKRVEALRGRYGVQRRRDGRQGSLFWLSIPYKPDEMFAEHQRSIRVDATNTANISMARTDNVPAAPCFPTSSVSPSRTLGKFMENEKKNERETEKISSGRFARGAELYSCK